MMRADSEVHLILTAVKIGVTYTILCFLQFECEDLKEFLHDTVQGQEGKEDCGM